MENTAEGYKDFKEYMDKNYKGILSNINNSPKKGVRIRVEPNSIRMPNGKTIYNKRTK